MKMSKSIKDYREAMDNIKISDSFYKRTETLLTELNKTSETKIEKRRTFSAGRIAALMSAAAACIIAAVGFRAALSDSTETGELTEATVLTEVCGTAEVTDTASPLIDDIAVQEDADFDGGIPAPQNGQGVAQAGSDADGEVNSTETTGKTAAETAAPETVSSAPETSVTASKTSVTAATTAAPPVKPQNPGVLPTAGDPAAPAETTAAKETDITSAPLMEQAVPTETVPLLSDINFDAAMVEITPYFDMGNIKSGENAVKKTGAECKDIIGFISGITQTSHEIGNYSFTSLFSLQITDSVTGTTIYNIYVTDLNTVVITKHDDAGQTRVTYGVNASDYEALKHVLFLQFGAEDDYELFSSLISGK